jgi:hypothetical protein
MVTVSINQALLLDRMKRFPRVCVNHQILSATARTDDPPVPLWNCRASFGKIGGMFRLIAIYLLISWAVHGAAQMQPVIVGPWWQIAGDPDLGAFTAPRQQPVDFAIWQATDGTWQLWSCIRGTRCGGNTRLFHRWEGAVLTNSNWKPMGIAMQADVRGGETQGGLQAPFVFRTASSFRMVYGDWEHICSATSSDGKQFTRIVNTDNRASLFGEDAGANTRDPMVIRVGASWHCYYTAHPNGHGAVYCRTSNDLRSWSPSRIVAVGGQAGAGPYSAECPFVFEQQPGQWYLFRTQHYGTNAQTSVYHSTDPMNFGINEDAGHFVSTLPVAAPEIVKVDGQCYVAALLPTLKGIQITRLGWQEK